MFEMNLPIAVKGFGVLILDYENPDSVCGRILNDGYFVKYFVATSRQDAINKFLLGEI